MYNRYDTGSTRSNVRLRLPHCSRFLLVREVGNGNLIRALGTDPWGYFAVQQVDMYAVRKRWDDVIPVTPWVSFKASRIHPWSLILRRPSDSRSVQKSVIIHFYVVVVESTTKENRLEQPDSSLNSKENFRMAGRLCARRITMSTARENGNFSVPSTGVPILVVSLLG